MPSTHSNFFFYWKIPLVVLVVFCVPKCVCVCLCLCLCVQVSKNFAFEKKKFWRRNSFVGNKNIPRSNSLQIIIVFYSKFIPVNLQLFCFILSVTYSSLGCQKRFVVMKEPFNGWWTDPYNEQYGNYILYNRFFFLLHPSNMDHFDRKLIISNR